MKGYMVMNMIVAVDNNWAIGYKGDLLVKIPADQQFFREQTTGKIVIMGRKTLESFPNGMPLPKRTNIVLTRDKDFSVKGAIVVHSIQEVLNLLRGKKKSDIYVIGGESIYKAFLPYADTIHLTKINYEYEADTYFPNLEQYPEWILVGKSEEQTYFDLEYYFHLYKRKKEKRI